MLTRILVAAAAIPLIILLVFLAPLWGYALFVGAISAGAAWELLRCAEGGLPLRFRVYASATAFSVVMSYGLSMGSFDGARAIGVVYLLIVVILFAELMLSFRKEAQLSFVSLLYTLFAGAAMPMLLGALIRIGLTAQTPAYLFLPFVVTFSSDSGGYFAGYFWGKKKAFPHLSPNKTVAGCIGGLVAAVVFTLGYGALSSWVTGAGFRPAAWTLYGLLGSVACQFGDLAFSAIKRQHGIKDYGSLIPGHGGMLDRFDSIHFTAPVIELLIVLLPAIR